MKDYTTTVIWGKSVGRREFGHGKDETPEPMEPHCKKVIITLIK